MSSTPKKMIFAFPLGFLLCLSLLLSACSSDQPAATGNGTPAATATTGGNGGVVIKAAQVNVKGTTKAVLTDPNGRTLYYFTADTADTSACTGGCTKNWPPLLYHGTGLLTGGAGVTGNLATKNIGNDNFQVLYNDHFLYTYAGDTAVSQANGEGVGGKWFVATPDLKGSGNVVVKTAKVNVGGTTKTILTDANGRTLYVFSDDTVDKSLCTGDCAKKWLPVLYNGTDTPPADPSVNGILSVKPTDNGNQVRYNSYFLYTYVGDTAAGQTNGDGLGNGKWSVISLGS